MWLDQEVFERKMGEINTARAERDFGKGRELARSLEGRLVEEVSLGSDALLDIGVRQRYGLGSFQSDTEGYENARWKAEQATEQLRELWGNHRLMFSELDLKDYFWGV
ncbi:MAG: hypothetical protein J4432_01445 [DPANN group archaeon]|nr:hypothetical protein [DPANN group archaeon]